MNDQFAELSLIRLEKVAINVAAIMCSYLLWVRLW